MKFDGHRFGDVVKGRSGGVYLLIRVVVRAHAPPVAIGATGPLSRFASAFTTSTEGEFVCLRSDAGTARKGDRAFLTENYLGEWVDG